MAQTTPLGIYFLANDHVLPWVRSFVRSFRQHNPDLPLCLIPFNDNSAGTRRIVQEAGGTVLELPETFERLERIGAALELGHTATGRHWFRRFAAFEGGFERFLYLDTRIVVLSDLRFFALAPQTYDVDLVHYDVAIEQVYQPGPIRREFIRAGRGQGFISNIWATRRGLFTMEQMERAGRELVAVRSQMNPRNTDQFFLNYLCDSNQASTAHLADLTGELVHTCWAADCRKIYRDADQRWRVWDFGHLSHRRIVPLVHWAGIQLAPSMPHYSLFKTFQKARVSGLERIADVVRGLPGRCLYTLRSNRHLNTLYHSLFGSRGDQGSVAAEMAAATPGPKKGG